MTAIQTTKEKVTLIGLGAMGSVLGNLLLDNNFGLTVWNRSEEKTTPFTARGAAWHSDVAKAVDASRIVIVCITNYVATRELLDGVSLNNKVLVQLSSGTPQDAKETEIWAKEKGAIYLDGAIMATPRQMGQPDSPIFFSGSEAGFKESGPALKALAGTLLYLGEGAGKASAWDLATLSTIFGMLTGFLHGALMMEAEGLRVDELGTVIGQIAPVLGQMVKSTGDDIQIGHYSDPESSLAICAHVFELLIRHAKEAGISHDIPSFELALYNRGVAGGWGNSRLAALMNILRQKP